ncbi:MAG: hypothetical protein JWQ38_1040 [Flavipsychrobacter sp.]|nr:hypothetical protein [Flavipsychrobacter sp.]
MKKSCQQVKMKNVVGTNELRRRNRTIRVPDVWKQVTGKLPNLSGLISWI